MSSERDSAENVERVEPRVRDALVGEAIGLLLVYGGTLMSPGIPRWLVIVLGVIFILVMTGFIVATLWMRFEPRLRPIAKKARGHTRRDDQLGTLIRNAKDGYWEATVTAGGEPIELLIDGEAEPVPALLAHARELAADLEALQRRLADYLAKEATGAAVDDPEWADEIGGLRLSSLAFLSSAPPGHVRIDFDLTDDERYWTCDYVDGELSGLDYD